MKENFFNRYPIVRDLLLMVALSLVLLAIAFFVIKIYARQGEEYEMPAVEGKSHVEILDDNALGLRYVVVDSLYQHGIAGGTVLKQDPSAGSMIKKGRKVYITIARYHEEDAQVPEVVGRTLREAVSILSTEGISIGKLTFIEGSYSSGVSQIPPTVTMMTYKGKELYSGKPLPRDAKVDLVVEKGSAETSTTIPFLLGKSAFKARRSAITSLFNITEHYDNNVRDRNNAVVYRQEPQYTGVLKFDYGTTIEVWCCNPDEIDVDTLVRNFKVDSSLFAPEPVEEEDAEDYIIKIGNWKW